MKEAVLAPLRRGILADGSIHPRVLARWKAEDAYGPALRAIDDVSPGFSASFATADQAANALTDAALEQRRRRDHLQMQAAARALGVGRSVDATKVENAIGDMLSMGFDGVTPTRELVQSVRGDSDALAGLRKAAVAWIVRERLGSTEAGKSSLILFLTDSRDTLRELFPHSHVTMLSSAARSIEMDICRVANTMATTGPTMGFVAVMGLLGIPAAANSARLVSLLRQAGIREAEALYQQMFLGPELARLMIGKMPRSLESSKWQALKKALWPESLSHRDAAQ